MMDSSDLVYQAVVAIISGIAGFLIGLGVSWRTRFDDDGKVHFNPTLNTNKGARALFAVIAVLALGSVITTAIVNQRSRNAIINQANCNVAIMTRNSEYARVNKDDIVNNSDMVRAVALSIATPREERQPTAFTDALKRFLVQAEANAKVRDAIPDNIKGCEKAP